MTADNYYPSRVAADMLGYSLRQVERLAQQGRIRSRWQGRRLLVHLGSLVQHRSACNQHRRELTCLDGWLINQPRCQLSYRQLADMASHALKRPVTVGQLRRSFTRINATAMPN